MPLFLTTRTGSTVSAGKFAANGAKEKSIDLVTVFDAILTSRQMHEKLQCLCENLKSNNFRRSAVLKKI